MAFTILDGELLCYHEEEGVTDVVIPDGVTSIYYRAFTGCKNLESITIPDGVKQIMGGAFSSCSSLRSIIIPRSLATIESETFYQCTNLEDVTIPESTKNIDGWAFFGTLWLKRKQEENPLVIINNTLVNGAACSGDIVIPDGVTSISGNAFLCNSNLESIVIPESVTSIGHRAFVYCKNLMSITIPNSIKSIDEYAFGDCKKLEYIILKGKKAEIKISTDKYFLTSTGCVSAEAVRLLKFIEADDNEKEAAFAEIKKSCYKIPVAVFLAEEYDSETAKGYLKRVNKKAVEYFTALGEQDRISKLI